MHPISQLPSREDIDLPRDPPFWSRTTWIQLAYGMWVNQVVILIGLSYGFSAIAIPQLKEPTGTFKSTLAEQAWIASIVVLAAPIGCVICGFLMDRIGRRWMLVLCLVPMVVGWTYTGFSDSASKMIQGRAITGIGVGLCAGPPRTYSTEISLPNARGVTGALPTFAVSLGIFTQGFLGKLLKWQTICYICAGYSGFLMLMNMFLPETPYYVLIGGDLEKIKRILKRLRANDYNVDRELEQMIIFKENNNIHKLPLKKAFLNLLKPYSLKPFSIIMVYIIFGQMSGISIVLFWTVDLLMASRLSIDPYIGNIVLGATRVLAGLVTSVLVFLVARRPLAIGSALCIGILCICLGLFLKSCVTPTIVPLMAYMIYIMCSLAGYYSLPLMMLFELIPLQVRGSLGGITVSLLFLMMFFANASYPFVRNLLGTSTTIILFGMFSLLGSGYLFFYLPETKDLTLQQIEEFYRGRHDSLTRQSVDNARRTIRTSSLMRQKLSPHLKDLEIQQHEHVKAREGLKRTKSSVNEDEQPVRIKNESETDKEKESEETGKEIKKRKNEKSDKISNLKETNKQIKSEETDKQTTNKETDKRTESEETNKKHEGDGANKKP